MPAELHNRLRTKINELSSRLDTLNTVLNRELCIEPKKRNYTLLAFLREELSIYQYARDQLQDLQPSPDPTRVTDWSSPKNILLPGIRNLEQKTNLYLHFSGGLGDVLCVTPTLRALRAHYPKLKVTLFLESESRLKLLKGNPYVDFIRKLETVSKSETEELVRLSVGELGTDVQYRAHASEIVAGPFNITLDSIKPDIFLSTKELSEASNNIVKHSMNVAIFPTSRQPSNQNWPLENWQQLVRSNPDIQFYQLGQPDEPLIDGVIDYRMVSGLRKSLALLANMNACAGMDTFWGHAAAAVNTSAVILFGGTHPAVFGYPEHINISRNLRCSPCHHRLKGQNCPYNTECINTISVKEVSEAVLSQVRK